MRPRLRARMASSLALSSLIRALTSIPATRIPSIAGFRAGMCVALIAALMSWGPGCAPKRIPPAKRTAIERHLEQGSRMVAAARYPSAIKEFEWVIERDPDNLEAHLGLGLTYLHTTYYQGAVDEFSRALAIDESSPDAHYGLGAARFQLGDDDKAEIHFSKAIELYPEHAPAYYSLAVIREKRNDDAWALECYERAVAIDPVLTEAQINLGLLCIRTGRFTQAIGALLEAKTIAPDLIPVRLALAEAYRRSGQLSLSLEEIDDAYDIKPLEPGVHRERGLTLRAMEMLPEAQSSFMKALTLDPDDLDSLLGLAEVQTRRGDHSGAETTLRHAVQAHSSSVEATYRLGAALAAQGKRAEAVEQLRHALTLGPDPQTAGKIEALLEELQSQETEDTQ